MNASVPASVVIPTIGRAEQLRACLESLLKGDAHAAEILVVDQSRERDIGRVVGGFGSIGARAIPCQTRGIGRGMNLGLHEAQHEIVLVTHDDCTVAPSWVSSAWKLMATDSRKLVTGRVVPGGDPRAVPSVKDDLAPHDYTGEIVCGAIWPNNMALNRSMVLELGGFDERFDTAAEDNDLCYRWVRAGHRLHYEPALVVWHHDVRSHAELERVYVNYWRGQGRFYAKHLRRGDLTMLRFMLGDVKRGMRGMAARVLRGRPRWSDQRRGILRGLPSGLREGWRLFGPMGEPHRPAARGDGDPFQREPGANRP
jgi:GT2 family glycosyltransferase